MRTALSAAALVGAASAINLQHDAQQVLGGATEKVKGVASGWADKVKEYEAAFGSMTSEARALWDEIALLVPNAYESIPSPPQPKKHVRRPDSEWDFVTKGADVQALWTKASAEEESRRLFGGDLESYKLRTKAVDPSKLGVDTVKQYSGYLDDEANDKHLFYCESNHARANTPCLQFLALATANTSCYRVLRVSK